MFDASRNPPERRDRLLVERESNEANSAKLFPAAGIDAHEAAA